MINEEKDEELQIQKEYENCAASKLSCVFILPERLQPHLFES